MFLKIKDPIKESQYSKKNKAHFVDTLSRRTYFWDIAVPWGSKNSNNVVQLNPDEQKQLSSHTISYTHATTQKNFTRKH